jgi:hypothetical protein
MSGDAETPPTYYFSGMTFNPDFYTSSSSTYITKITGKKYFLTYPTAQGDETINNIYAENISPITSTENIYIGSSQTLGTMEIAMSTARTGTLKINSSSTSTNTIYFGSTVQLKYQEQLKSQRVLLEQEHYLSILQQVRLILFIWEHQEQQQ